MLVNFVKIFGPVRECPLFPKAVIRIGQFGLILRSAFGQKRSFKDGLTEQMNSFDECRLSPRSGPSLINDIISAIGSNRPPADLRLA